MAVTSVRAQAELCGAGDHSGGSGRWGKTTAVCITALHEDGPVLIPGLLMRGYVKHYFRA